MCFFDPDKDHLHIGLSVGGFVSRSKDLLKKLTIIDDKGGSRGGHQVMAPKMAKILKQIGPHIGDLPVPSQYATLPNEKSWNRP